MAIQYYSTRNLYYFRYVTIILGRYYDSERVLVQFSKISHILISIILTKSFVPIFMKFLRFSDISQIFLNISKFFRIFLSDFRYFYEISKCTTFFVLIKSWYYYLYQSVSLLLHETGLISDKG